MENFLYVIKNGFNFEGRARRQEFWMFQLFYYIGMIALVAVSMLLKNTMPAIGGILFGVYALAMLFPAIACSIRRLHDTNRSGWFLLMGLIPIVGGIVVLVFMVLEGTPGSNDYGSNPKEVGSATMQTS